MSVYCVGDLHGRYDLFTMLLEKIGYDPARDRLYLLGDVIDWNYGGIKIINYAMKHHESCTLIQGNHESHFINMGEAYDVIMLNPELKKTMIDVVDVYSSNLFNQISDSFISRIPKKKKRVFYTSPLIKKWLKTGNSRVRRRLLDTMVALVEQINYDEDKYEQMAAVLNNLHGQYKTKAFVQELLKQSLESYFEIKDFLKQAPHSHKFKYKERNFCLTHWIGSINPSVISAIQYPHANSTNTTYIYGHDPVPLYHRRVQNNANCFDFDFRLVFSWIDTQNNCYYNLDLSSNPVAALKLDDMSEYYVGIPPRKKLNTTPWIVPENRLPLLDSTHHLVENARLGGKIFHNSAYITMKKGCYEFLIGISKRSKCIYYARISWLDFRHIFLIENWFDGHSVEEVIEKVQSDFSIQVKLPENQKMENFLHGIYSK